MSKRWMIDNIVNVGIIISIIGLVVYHFLLSDPDYLQNKYVDCFWVVSENVLCLSMCYYVMRNTSGIIHLMFSWPLMIYFIFRAIFYITCYLKLYIWSVQFWNLLMIAPLIAGILFVIVRILFYEEGE